MRAPSSVISDLMRSARNVCSRVLINRRYVTETVALEQRGVDVEELICSEVVQKFSYCINIQLQAHQSCCGNKYRSYNNTGILLMLQLLCCGAFHEHFNIFFTDERDEHNFLKREGLSEVAGWSRPKDLKTPGLTVFKGLKLTFH